MKKENVLVCDAIHIDVSCVKTEDDVLGYDFYISPNDDLLSFTEKVKELLVKYNRPLIEISVGVKKNYDVYKLWSFSDIENCIKKYEV